jgi:hypothetical protein
MNKILQENLSCLENLIATQKRCVEDAGAAVDYMHGMANGMILAHSIFSDHRPKFISRPRRPYGRIIRHKSARSKKGRK